MGPEELVVKIATNSNNSSEVTYRDKDRFEFHNKLKSWNAAEQSCEGNGGHLATILSEQDQMQVDDVLTGYLGFVWLGGRQGSGQSQCSWVSGEEVGYHNWDAGKPSRNGRRDDCVYMSGNTKKWLYNECSENRTFVCQYAPIVMTGNLT